MLLAGQVANEEMKTQAGNIAQRVRHVRHVHNELDIIGAGSALAHVNDAWITSKVKTRLAFNGDAPASRTKVVTENGVVYLFGLLTREEADAVVAQVQKVYGVQKIVKIDHRVAFPDHLHGIHAILGKTQHRGIEALIQVGVVGKIGDIEQRHYGHGDRSPGRHR